MANGSGRLKGTVKWFNGAKGFGFITPDDGGEDLFVHQSSIKAEGYRSLAEGEAVEFAIAEGEDGRTKAVDVTGPDGSSVQGGGRRDGFGGGGGRGYGGGYEFDGGAGRSGGVRGGGYGGGGGVGACYNCGETGHRARDCYKGGGGGGGGGGAACYSCGETGHLARDCYRVGGGGGAACFKCGETGHLARDCYTGGGGGGGGSCYTCGEMGHFARECPSANLLLVLSLLTPCLLILG